MRIRISAFALVALALPVLPLALSSVLAAPSGDFNGDGKVDFTDFVLLARVYGTNRDQARYDAKYDLDGNGEIGFPDFLAFARDFGKEAPPANGGASDDPFALKWNNLPQQPWWRPSAAYSCAPTEKTSSPWIEAGLQDLGGSDPLSLIRYWGNGSYLRYGDQSFEGCTPMVRYPDRTHLDPPADPTYYTLGDLEVWIDIARFPSYARVWDHDDGSRVAMTMEEAVSLMNTHVAPYWQRVSGGRLRVTFRAGLDIDLHEKGGRTSGTGWFGLARTYLWMEVADCHAEWQGCPFRGYPGGLNRILFSDVTSDTGGSAYNGFGEMGLILLQNAKLETIVHEMGHGWMLWPHSFTELQWHPSDDGRVDAPNPYSNRFDFMSSLTNAVPGTTTPGWRQDMPPPMAINRYSAGWIDADDVALHTADTGTYRLSRPFDDGRQFLVIHSGRKYAFTTLEVLPERPDAYATGDSDVYDPSAPGGQRAFRYDGVLVSRYDQSRGAGTNTRFGPALYDASNPDAIHDVGWGRDDYSLMGDGESREIGSGVTVSAQKNDDGSYNVSVKGGRIASFEPWCYKIWFEKTVIYDTGCKLDDGQTKPSEPPDEPDTGVNPPGPPDAPDKPGAQFRDCAECPLMTVVPSGSFTMGMSDSEFSRFFTGPNYNGPTHRVDIGYQFAVGVHEVTFTEWEACPPCTFYSPSDNGWGRGDRPLVFVSWDHVQVYLNWLSSHTGARYRLLSEAEWEYAARAGTTGPYHFGNTISTDQANFNPAWEGSGVNRGRTVPVGSFPANAFGLHDVHGNVWEWTQDCWHGDYQGAPSDGSAWGGDDCRNPQGISDRVLRGGSWQDPSPVVRSSFRTNASSNDIRNVAGFRVARDLKD